MNKKEAKKILLNNANVDRIIETHESYNYIQFIVSCGGDICTYRVYDNGDIFEK